MKDVTLQFTSIKELIDFSVVAGIPTDAIDRKDLTLTYELSKADIELAKYSFGAIRLTTLQFQD